MLNTPEERRADERMRRRHVEEINGKCERDEDGKSEKDREENQNPV